MNSLATVSGSPLLARQNVTLWGGILIIAACVIVCFVIIAILLKKLQTHSSPEWVAKNKDKLTQYKNVINVTHKYHLNTKEQDLLWDVCKTQNAPNIEYLIHYPEKLIEHFRLHYVYLLGKQASSEQINLLYTLLYHLEQAHASSKEISSSKSIPDGTDFSYIDHNGRKYSLLLQRHDKDVMYLQPSEAFLNSASKPPALDKVLLYFILPGNLHYMLVSRIMRYEVTASGISQILLTHTNNLLRFNRRQSKRVPIDLKCRFSAVKIEDAQNGRKGEVQYTPSGELFDGKFSDISSGGASIITSMALKIDQYIHIEYTIDSFHTDHVIGVICRSNKNSDTGVYSLHIKFLKISLEEQNRILTHVYNF